VIGTWDWLRGSFLSVLVDATKGCQQLIKVAKPQALLLLCGITQISPQQLLRTIDFDKSVALYKQIDRLILHTPRQIASMESVDLTG